jgi:hypothetical protein
MNDAGDQQFDYGTWKIGYLFALPTTLLGWVDARREIAPFSPGRIQPYRSRSRDP